ncbi:glutathione S-transferase family protein [Zooshikella harenae]|uniref:Glutathione S-transferase family protein n=1 Tax=Zooshikella harenae TaxID=2827238 RepID=A0ABS5Z9N0_9GAMM|nr:glutathione S-transferase family protein [Zooshikella harenae]MBU2710026.1 glutathione S-transferase family protein [Zooshikella harenae]
MIKLYRFGPGLGLPELSPFCMKVETFMRMFDIQHKSQFIRNPQAGPNGKLPFIKAEDLLIADSYLIIDYLVDRFSLDIKHGLSVKALAHGYMMCRMLEEHYYWILMYSRWVDKTNWPVIKSLLMENMPPGVGSFISLMTRGHVKRQLLAQGLGRHKPDVIYQLGCRDLTTVADLLTGSSFVLGEEPTVYDAVAHAFLVGTLCTKFPSPLQQHAQSLPVLIEYCERINQRYYPDGD